MPAYTYKCDNCGEFDYHHSMHESLKTCIYCNNSVSKVFSVGAITFKGKGFYSTDSKGKK